MVKVIEKIIANRLERPLSLWKEAAKEYSQDNSQGASLRFGKKTEKALRAILADPYTLILMPSKAKAAREAAEALRNQLCQSDQLAVKATAISLPDRKSQKPIPGNFFAEKFLFGGNRDDCDTLSPSLKTSIGIVLGYIALNEGLVIYRKGVSKENWPVRASFILNRRVDACRKMALSN